MPAADVLPSDTELVGDLGLGAAGGKQRTGLHANAFERLAVTQAALELIEAKGTATRDQLRAAVGQLLDYGRFVDAKHRSVLLPSRPRADLLAYLHAVGVDAIYPNGDDWERA